MRILAVHGFRYVPVEAAGAWLVAARVAGYDHAVYGLPKSGVWPVLFEHSPDVLVATTALSRFVTGRYAPADAWEPIWKQILGRLCPSHTVPELKWTPTVRPSHARGSKLPSNAERTAFRKGVDWHMNARLFVHPSWAQAEAEAWKYKNNVAPMPKKEWPNGDGSLGVLEGFNSAIHSDGSQWMRWWKRNDCTGETSMAMAFSGELTKRPQHSRIAANLSDWIYFNSVLSKGSRDDPKSPSFGLVGWHPIPKYHSDMDGFGVYYGDDNARSMLGTLASAALLESDRWDDRVMRCLLANLRTTGRLGFRGNRLDEGPVQKNGWRHYWNGEVVNPAPHYEAHLWAAFLWAYDKTGYRPFLERTQRAIRSTMGSYPDRWKWANGMQQERARMMLPLAWLIRIEDTPEHRGWLRTVTGDLLARQDGSGAIREELGVSAKGDYGPPKTNEEYGTNEAALIQENGDPLADMLYTTNFAFIALREAAAATGDPYYRDAEDRLADFLVRIQVCSERHPELDGAWFRAFDFRRWDYWASNADAGWGAWSIEAGWTQGWISAVFGLRQMRSSYWDLTKGSRIGSHLNKYVELMELPAP
jgi:hypothetical protein